MDTANLQGLCYICPPVPPGMIRCCPLFGLPTERWYGINAELPDNSWSEVLKLLLPNFASFNEILLHCNNQKIGSVKASKIFSFSERKKILHLSQAFCWFCTSNIQKSLFLLSQQCSFLCGRTLVFYLTTTQRD